jgi:hypothetical protein
MQLAAGRGFGFVIASGQDTARTQNPVGTFPEVSCDMLAAGLDIRDRATAVSSEPGELRLGVADRATVGGKLHA